jgi:hypothetical protein
MKKIFKYLAPLWSGNDGKISLRSLGAIALITDFITNISFAIRKWEVGKSYADVAMVLGIEAALIAAMLALKTYQNTISIPGLGSNSSTTSSNTPPVEQAPQ